MIGVNDLSQNKSPDYVLTIYSKILLAIKEASPKTQVFVQSILPVNDGFGKFGNHTSKGAEIKQVNKQLASLARNFNYSYIERGRF